eukprot:XP_001698205.1 predicted protein [Chlamydomonas reinhardtii]
MLAAQKGHVDVIRSLLFRGAHMGAADDRGWTALHFAAAAGQAVAARALLTAAAGGRGGLLEAQNGKGETALALAAFGRKEEVVRVLLLSGARRQAVQDAADSDYVAKLARAAGAATAADGPGAVAVAGGDAAGGGGGGGGGQQSARSPGGPAMQFSGTASEYERIFSPPPSEPVTPYGAVPPPPAAAGPRTPACNSRPAGGSAVAAARAPLATRGRQQRHHTQRGDGGPWTQVAREERAGSIQRFPALVGRLQGGVPRWLGPPDLSLLTAVPQVSELRELAMLDPDDAPAAFAAAWGPSGLGPAHVTQLRTALLAALKPQGGRAHGDEEAAGLGTAGPLPVGLAGGALVQHLLERYGLAKLMVAELQITEPRDLLATARDKARAEAALGPALEAMLRQRRLEALARPSRGCLVLYDDLDGASSGSTTASTAVAATGGGRKDNRSRRQKRVAVSGLSVELLGACLRRVRAAELPKGTVRPDYMPPASLGPPVTPLSAAAGVLVTRGHAWGRGPAYDMYGEGVVGELVGPDPESASAANGNGNSNGHHDDEDPDYAAEDVTDFPVYGSGDAAAHRGAGTGSPGAALLDRSSAGLEMPQAMAGGPALAGTHFYHKYYKSWQTGPEPGGPGTLLAPLRLEAGGLVAVWLVAWPNAGRREARVGAVGGDCDLVFAPQADVPYAKPRLPHEHWHHQGAEGRLPCCVLAPCLQGMLVRRCYDDGSSLKTSSKEQQAGAPLAMPRTLDALAEMAVAPGFDCTAPWAAEAGGCDVAVVGGSSLQVDESSKLRLLVAERMPLVVGPAARQLRYSAGDAAMRPAPALSPQQQLPHRNTGLRVVLQTSANSTGASQTGTLTRPLRLGTKVDRGTVMWEVSWDAGDTSVWAVGLSASASALRVAPQPGFKSPAVPALRDASPRDRHLRVLDPVTYTPLPHGPRVLDDHLYSLLGHLDTAGDTLLLSVGLSAAALSVGQQPSQGPTAHLDPEAAQQLLAGSERAAAADAELAAAAAALELSHASKLYDTDPLLVQEMIETFHSYTARLVSAAPTADPQHQQHQQHQQAMPLGPLALAALDVAPEVAAAVERVHDAMCAYTALQAAEWRLQITEMYGTGSGGVGGGAGSDVGAVAARRGHWHGLSLTTTSPPLVAVAGGVSVGDLEGLVEAREDATAPCPSQLGARLNDSLLRLWRCAGRANGCGGSVNVCDAVVKMYSYLHGQMAKAVASYGVSFMGADAGAVRQEVAEAAQQAAATAEGLEAAAALAFASKVVAAAGISSPRSVSGAAEALATLSAELCNVAVDQAVSGAEQLKEGAKEPDRINAKQRTLGKAAAAARLLRSLATSHAALAPGGSLPAPAAASLARAAEGAAVACRDAADAAKAIGNDAVAKARVAVGTKENLEHGARLQLELLEAARAVTDLAEVAAGASDGSRVRDAQSDIAKALDDSDREMDKIDRYSREHPILRAVAVAVGLKGLAAGAQRLPQLVAEAERELRKSVAVGRELWGRGSGAATGAVAEVEEARSKASPEQLLRLHGLAEAAEDALRLLAEGLGVPRGAEGAAAAASQLTAASHARAAAFETAAAAFGGAAAAQRAAADPAAALLETAASDDEPHGGSGGGGRLGDGDDDGRGGAGGEPTAEIVFRPVFVQTPSAAGASREPPHNAIQFHVAVLLKPLEALIEAANLELAAAAVALRDMAVEADLLAPLLGQPGGGALLRGSRDGPPGLQLALQRYGPDAEALVRANLRQAGRYTSVLEAFRAVSGGLAEGLQRWVHLLPYGIDEAESRGSTNGGFPEAGPVAPSRRSGDDMMRVSGDGLPRLSDSGAATAVVVGQELAIMHVYGAADLQARNASADGGASSALFSDDGEIDFGLGD